MKDLRIKAIFHFLHFPLYFYSTSLRNQLKTGRLIMTTFGGLSRTPKSFPILKQNELIYNRAVVIHGAAQLIQRVIYSTILNRLITISVPFPFPQRAVALFPFTVSHQIAIRLVLSYERFCYDGSKEKKTN